MALFGGLESGRVYLDDGAHRASPAPSFSTLAALIQKNWRRLLAAAAPGRRR